MSVNSGSTDEIFSAHGLLEYGLPIFSIFVLMPVAVLISGRLMASRILLDQSKSPFVINIDMKIIKIMAQGAEVTWGFIIFILALVFTMAVWGPDAKVYIVSKTGLNIGVWTAYCAVASFSSLIISLFLCAIRSLLRSSSLLSKQQRDDQLKELTKQDEPENEANDA